MNDAQPCELLVWDTEFFGVRIARAVQSQLTDQRVADIRTWCSQHKIACLYFVADLNHAVTTQLAEQNGFNLVDVRLTFECKTGSLPPNITTRPVKESDVPAIINIAKTSFTDTRFYFDSRFPREKCQLLYEVWTQKSCNRSLTGDGVNVLVATINGTIAGFITCETDRPAGMGSIGLIGVAPSHRGKGMGGSLVAAALSWFSAQQVERTRVVTQARNLAAQRLYQHAGFVTTDVKLYYHLWMSHA